MSTSERLNRERVLLVVEALRKHGPMRRERLEQILGLNHCRIREAMTYGSSHGLIRHIPRGGLGDLWCLPEDEEGLRLELREQAHETRIADQADKRAAKRAKERLRYARNQEWFEAQPVHRIVTKWKAPSRIPVNSVFALAEEA